MIPREEGQGKAEKSTKWKLEGPGLIYLVLFFLVFTSLPLLTSLGFGFTYLRHQTQPVITMQERIHPSTSHRVHPPQYHHWGKTHVKAKKSVVAPTKKMAAAETGTYLLGLNFFPDSAGMLEL